MPTSLELTPLNNGPVENEVNSAYYYYHYYYYCGRLD